MPRRSPLSLEDITTLDTLAQAFWRSARGRAHRPEVARFRQDLDGALRRLRADILEGRAPEGRWTELAVFDPKPRRILAPSFPDRVLHHALMAHMGPVIDRALVADTFACRVGRGNLAAVLRAQRHLRRFPWFVQVDMRGYFASIDHTRLMGCIARRFKHPALLALCARILGTVPGLEGRGLPIGALTSQYFANLYLDGFDRFLLEHCRVPGMVRYMDDVVWWCVDRAQARASLVGARQWLAEARALTLKEPVTLGRSAAGLTFLGFRVRTTSLRLSLRRRRRYAAGRARWERWYREGRIDALALQRGYASVHAITARAAAQAWRQHQLQLRPPLDA